jgi:aromatic ring-opening dioxygenase catalytic subunit (LigB family)
MDPATRITLALLSRYFDWRDALVVVRPETLIRWHRAGWKLFWRLKSRPGRPAIPLELRKLIRRMADEYPSWGQERIANELLVKLDIQVSPRTVSKYLPRRPRGRPRGDLRWSTFLRRHTLYPDADMPLVQLSLRADYDPAEHIKVGELLGPLRDEGVLIVGSGFSYHDTRGMRSGAGAEASASFDRWLNDSLIKSSPDERRRRLLRWSAAPAARAAHPREDHLIPLMVAVGAAGDDVGTRIYHQSDFMGAITVSSYRFGAPVLQTSGEMVEETA